MGSTNSRGVYMYDEGDTAPTASEMLNKQSEALSARGAVLGGSGSLRVPGGNAVVSDTVTLGSGLGGTPTSIILQNRSPLSIIAGLDYRVTSVNATTFTVEARYSGSAETTWTFYWMAFR